MSNIESAPLGRRWMAFVGKVYRSTTTMCWSQCSSARLALWVTTLLRLAEYASYGWSHLRKESHVNKLHTHHPTCTHRWHPFGAYVDIVIIQLKDSVFVQHICHLEVLWSRNFAVRAARWSSSPIESKRLVPLVSFLRNSCPEHTQSGVTGSPDCALCP